jgi:alpha-glucuronidase
MTRIMIASVIAAALMAAPASAADDAYSGSDLWLHYERVSDAKRLHQYRDAVKAIVVENAERNKVYRHTQDLRM